MAREWVILMQPDRWQLWSDAAEPLGQVAWDDRTPLATIDELVALLNEHGYAGEGVTLAVPSEQCLCAVIETGPLPRRQMRQTLLYRMEEKLPVASEQVVADFIADDDHALGVCMQTDVWDPFIRAFKSAGVAVDLISPTALLALQDRADGRHASDCDVLVWAEENLLDFFVLDPTGRPQRWHALPDDGQALELQLRMATAQRSSPLRVAVRAPDPKTLVRQIQAVPQTQMIGSETASRASSAVRAALAIQSGKRPAWINLCRQSLAAASPVGQLRLPLQLAAAAVLVLWICLIGGMLWRASHYQQLVETEQAEQVRIYQQVFPDTKAPTGQSVKLRLSSERTRLAGMRRSDSSSQAMPSSVLPLLHRMLAASPKQLRYHIMELQLDETSLYIDGRVPNHSGADALATALKQGLGWQIQPPRTEMLPDASVGFTLRGSPASPTATASRD